MTDYETIFHLSPEATLLFDDNGDILACNQAAEELFGVPSPEIVGKNLGLFGPSAGYDFRPGIRGLTEAGFNNGDVRMTRGNGEVIDAEYRSRANISPGVHVTIVRDVSGQRRMEASLRSSEQLFARALIGAPAAIAVSVRLTKTCVLANERFLSAFGYWRSEVIGRNLAMTRLWSDAVIRAELNERLGLGQPVAPLRTNFRRKDGTQVECLVSVGVADVNDQACEILVAVPLVPGA